MKCREIIEILETLAPKSCACDWDNPGLLAGRIDKNVKKILLTLDADDAAVDRAKEIGADMLLSHHPLIFKPMKHVSDEDFIGRRLVSLIQSWRFLMGNQAEIRSRIGITECGDGWSKFHHASNSFACCF